MQEGGNLNFSNAVFDPFNQLETDFSDPTKDLNKQFKSKIHLRVQKRNARQSITSIEGLDHYQVELKKFLGYLRKTLCCNGSLKKNTEKGNIIIVQGDHRDEISKLLKKKYEVRVENIVIHGF